MNRSWPWLPLLLLGAYHGVNPGMGWLFALARGLQEKRRSAVVWSLVPIAGGHAVAIAGTLLLLRLAQGVLPVHLLKVLVASILFILGGYRLLKSRHPRGGGMRVGWWSLGCWSFLMASSHGAGLMVVPVLMAEPGHAHSHSVTTLAGIDAYGGSLMTCAVLVHTAGLLLAAGALAVLLYEGYEKFGLSMLQHAWFNFDLLWALALLVGGIAALAL